MSNKIFSLDADNQLREFVQTRYENEDIFQMLIENYPAILAGDQIDPDNPRQWIFVSREMGVPSEQDGSSQWYLDHLFIDQDSVPTLIEVKRSTDTRIRREVVAQMLDYAANAVQYWPVDTMRDLYEQQYQKGGTASLEDIGIAPDDEDTYWQTVYTNLRAGKIRMLFVADEIPLTLQRIIEFLNNQMVDAEVLGLEIRPYKSADGATTLVPNLVGQTASAIQTKQKVIQRDWDEDSFLDDVIRVSGKTAADICQRLLRDFEKMGCTISWGHGKTHGSFVPIYVGKQNYQLCSVYPWNTRTLIEIYFQYLKPPFDTMEFKHELRAKLEKISGVQIPEDRLSKRPNFEWSVLQTQGNYNLFINTYKWYIDKIKENENR